MDKNREEAIRLLDIMWFTDLIAYDKAVEVLTKVLEEREDNVWK